MFRLHWKVFSHPVWRKYSSKLLQFSPNCLTWVWGQIFIPFHQIFKSFTKNNQMMLIVSVQVAEIAESKSVSFLLHCKAKFEWPSNRIGGCPTWPSSSLRSLGILGMCRDSDLYVPFLFHDTLLRPWHTMWLMTTPHSMSGQFKTESGRWPALCKICPLLSLQFCNPNI